MIEREPFVYQVLRSMAEQRGERLTGWVKELVEPYQNGHDEGQQNAIHKPEEYDSYYKHT